MNTEESQLQVFASALQKLALLYPNLYFEDRRNPAHLKSYNETDKKGIVLRTCKPCLLEFARFQAWRPVLKKVELPAIPYVRGEVNANVTFRRLVAWASNPVRLGEMLFEKGVTK